VAEKPMADGLPDRELGLRAGQAVSLTRRPARERWGAGVSVNLDRSRRRRRLIGGNRLRLTRTKDLVGKLMPETDPRAFDETVEYVGGANADKKRQKIGHCRTDDGNRTRRRKRFDAPHAE